MGSLIVLVSLLASLLLRPALAFEGKPKFGPNAAPILEQTAYLRTAAAPDYWRLNPFYVSQTTSSDCSVASKGVLTGDWDGPHISPIAAYNEETRQVLIMDVDREWYVPYWATDTKLLEAMLRPAPAEHGPLAGETGGLVWIKPASSR